MTGQAKWARHREETRAVILRTALRLFAEHGYAQTTVRAIADECHLTERTIYRYFPHKEDFVRVEQDKAVAALLDLVRSQPPDARPLTAVGNALLSLHEIDPQAFVHLLHSAPDCGAPASGGPAPDLREQYTTALAAVIQERLATEDPLLGLTQARVISQAAVAVTRSACLSAAALPESERSPELLAHLLEEAFASIRLA
jgi:AcrR family transcriptional regulator